MEKIAFRKPMFQSRIIILFYKHQGHRSGQSSSIILAALATRASNLNPAETNVIFRRLKVELLSSL